MTSYSIRDISIVKQIDDAEKALAALKTKQYVSRRVLATKKIESQKILSQTANVAFPGPLLREVTELRVTFKADNQVSPYGRLNLEFYDLSGNLLDSDSGIQVFYLNDIVTYVDDGTLMWNLDARANGSGTIGLAKYYCKLIVYATDTGRISWKGTWENG